MQVFDLLRKEEKITKAHGHTRLLAKNYKCLLLMCERHPAHSKVCSLHETYTWVPGIMSCRIAVVDVLVFLLWTRRDLTKCILRSICGFDGMMV